MSECNLNGFTEGRVWAYPCERCGTGTCHIWRGANPIEPIGADPKTDDADASPTPTETRPDPAYAAGLSETSILVDARAKAFGLALRSVKVLDLRSDVGLDDMIPVSNRILKYLLDGK